MRDEASVIALIVCCSVCGCLASSTRRMSAAYESSSGHVRADGGDRRNTATLLDPDPIGKTDTIAFSRLEGPCGMGVSPQPLGDLGEASDGR